jgi:hypothetical protein
MRRTPSPCATGLRSSLALHSVLALFLYQKLQYSTVRYGTVQQQPSTCVDGTIHCRLSFEVSTGSVAVSEILAQWRDSNYDARGWGRSIHVLPCTYALSPLLIYKEGERENQSPRWRTREDRDLYDSRWRARDHRSRDGFGRGSKANGKKSSPSRPQERKKK